MLTLMSHKASTLLAAGKVRLVIIDSVAGLFRGADDAVKSPATAAEYFIKRAKKLSSLGSLLHRLSVLHDAVIITVNQVCGVCHCMHEEFIGPIPWGHSGPLCHALSLSSSALSWT